MHRTLRPRNPRTNISLEPPPTHTYNTVRATPYVCLYAGREHLTEPHTPPAYSLLAPSPKLGMRETPATCIIRRHTRQHLYHIHHQRARVGVTLATDRVYTHRGAYKHAGYCCCCCCCCCRRR